MSKIRGNKSSDKEDLDISLQNGTLRILGANALNNYDQSVFLFENRIFFSPFWPSVHTETAKTHSKVNTFENGFRVVVCTRRNSFFKQKRIDVDKTFKVSYFKDIKS